jgi:hydrogenase nickel incorporation protein HypA/HybF
MHELSIAISIVEHVEAAAAAEPNAAITVVHVRVGAYSGVIPQALRFAWDVATEGTKLAGSTLAIDEVGAAAYCPACDAERELPDLRLVCPACGGPTPRLVRGKELDLLSVELDDSV